MDGRFVCFNYSLLCDSFWFNAKFLLKNFFRLSSGVGIFSALIVRPDTLTESFCSLAAVVKSLIHYEARKGHQKRREIWKFAVWSTREIEDKRYLQAHRLMQTTFIVSLWKSFSLQHLLMSLCLRRCLRRQFMSRKLHYNFESLPCSRIFL